MESSNLNTPRNDDAQLATLIRTPEIPDDGFSDRVLASLPPACAPRLNWSWAAYVGGGLAGAMVVAFRAGPGPNVASVAHEFLEALPLALAALSDPWFMIGVWLAALSVAIGFAFSRPSWRLW